MHINDIVQSSSFFDSLNGYIALLDPLLHTPAYTRLTSPILHLSILCVTSMIFRPEVYPPLLERADVEIGTAFMKGEVSVGLCQALSLMSVWKGPEERRAWLRIGFAIR